ncbi:MAG: hypothetical protein ACRES6_09350 [Steroidobacteraceae bacterium]
MDRQIVYPQAQALETDLLSAQRNTLIGLGLVLQDLLGTASVAAGFGVTPGTGLTVSVAAGRIYSLQNVDNTAYSSLGIDTALQVIKQGILAAAATLNCPAPTTSGDSINYLIQGTYEDVDGVPAVLSYFDSQNPSQPFAGQNNSGTAQYTVRQGQAIVAAKAGTQAATGSQTTPAPDSGYIGLAVVTVAYGASSISSGNITAYASAPFIGSLGAATTGSQTASFSATNKPGAASGTPQKWIPYVYQGTTYYIPAFG